MRALVTAGIVFCVAVLATLFSGCASNPKTQKFYLGSMVTIDNVVVDPVDRTITPLDDKPHNIHKDFFGISRTPLLGWDFLGLQGAPWVGCRLGYLFDLGADIGFALATKDVGSERMNATFGLDYVITGDFLATGHFEQSINGDPLKFGYGACFVW